MFGSSLPIDNNKLQAAVLAWPGHNPLSLLLILKAREQQQVRLVYMHLDITASWSPAAPPLLRSC